MRRRILHALLALALAAPVVALPALAQGRGRGAPGAPVFDRDRRERSRISNSGRPPGWSQGRKTGWRNCDVPPGQAKKYGCRSTWPTRPVIVDRRHKK